ncbi:Rv0361 family membrane protein [Actinoplanes italicus]|nr:hypothetical protein [Actinoplanes italicus]
MTTPAVPGGRPAGRGGRFQSRRARLMLALTGGVMALLCAGGVGTFIVLYDEATEIKRSNPDAVVNDFLGAYLRNRDDNAARLYQCDSGDFSQLTSYRGDTQQREQQFSTTISFSWSIVALNVNGTAGAVNVDVTRTLAGRAGRDGSTWQLAVVDQDGWRVCGAEQTS